MCRKINLKISFSSENPFLLMKAISKNVKPFNQKIPDMVSDGYDKYTNTENWIDELIPKFKFSIMADWGDVLNGEDFDGFISYDIKEEIVKIQISNYELTDPRSVMKMLSPLPWTVASIFDFHGDNDDWDEYIAPGFGAFHFGLGWACAFKGEGHNRLVSRRWLEYNPWYLIRDEEHDISFVQFHDLEADPATALEQAKPGHRAMSIRGIGGFINKTHPFSTHPQGIYFGEELRGIYVHDTQNLRVVIPAGKSIDYYDMYNYCAAKYYQICEEGLITTISFVFIVAAEAEPHLYDLWLRNIECQ